MAQAQTAPTRASEPAQIEERTRTTPRPTGEVPPTAPTERPAISDETEATLVLTGVVIDGVSVFPDDAFVDLYEPLLGQEIGRADIAALVQAVTDRYREAGYVLSRAVAPAQDTSLGILRIQVLEGFVERVTFEGDNGGGKGVLQDFAERLRAERPLTMTTLERYLLLMADLPGLRVYPGVAPLDDLSPAHELVLRVTHDPADGFVGADNRGTRTVGRYFAQGAYSLNGALNQHERITLRGFTVPATPSELRFGEVRAELPIGSDGLTVAVDVWRSEIEGGGGQKPFDVDSMEDRAAVELLYPMLRSRDLSLYLFGQLDLRNSSQSVLETQAFDDRVRSLRVGARVFFDDPWDGGNWYYATVSRGLDIFGASDKGDAPLSRFDGDPEYTKLTVELIRRQRLNDDFSLQGWIYGQLTGDRMLSGEEFRLGGGIYGRAYDPSELIGDNGIAGAVELQYDVGAPFEPVTNSQIFTFYDFGSVWDDVAGFGTFRDSLSSAGLGVRFTLYERLYVTVEAAKPLTRDVFERDDRDWRAFFNIGLEF